MLMTERTPLVPSLYPVPVQGEKLCSLALRIEERMAAPSGMFWSLACKRARAIHGPSATPAQRIDQLVELLTSLLGSERVPTHAFERREEWIHHACPECADGQRAELSGPGPAVCNIHKRWTGPVRNSGIRKPNLLGTPHPAHGQLVAAQVVAAWAKVERLLEAGILSFEDMYPAYDLISIWRRGIPGTGPQPADLPAAAAIAEVLHDAKLQRQWMDPGIPARWAYRILSELLSELLDGADKRLIDVAWLAARPTVAHLRGTFLEEPGCGPADPQVALRFIPGVVMRPLEPFNRYLALVGESDFDRATLFPRTPEGILCRNGHAGARSYGPTREPVCPVCSGHRVVPGLNSIVETYPRVAAEWVRPTDDVDVAPETVSAGSNRLVVWVCPEGHEYPAMVVNRTTRRSGCPYCAGMKATPGENDLATCYPNIGAEWHPYRNGDLTPEEVGPGSGRLVWWLCPRGHDYQTPIQKRTGPEKAGCTTCSGRKLVSGVNDLATRYSAIARDWDVRRNGMPASQVVPGCQLRWWTCSYGHTQHQSFGNRLKSGGCTLCEPAERVAGGTQKGTRGRNGWDKRKKSLMS